MTCKIYKEVPHNSKFYHLRSLDCHYCLHLFVFIVMLKAKYHYVKYNNQKQCDKGMFFLSICDHMRRPQDLTGSQSVLGSDPAAFTVVFVLFLFGQNHSGIWNLQRSVVCTLYCL